MPRKKPPIDNFKPVDKIPARTYTRVSWITELFDSFLAGDEDVIACEYADKKTALSKQGTLKTAAKRDAYKDKLVIERRGNTIYIARAQNS